MNQKAIYEITIAKKLEQLSVPDVVDAIWAKIETQLDIDLPTDDGPSNPPSNPTAGGGTWIVPGIFLAVTALVATFFFNNKKNNIPAIQPGSENSPAIVSPVDNENNSLNELPFDNGKSGQKTDNGSTTAEPFPFFPDSLSLTDHGSVPNLFPDSLNLNKGTDIKPVVIAPQIVISDTAKKKKRGVQGINDGDYKITPVKKDSTKN